MKFKLKIYILSSIFCVVSTTEAADKRPIGKVNTVTIRRNCGGHLDHKLTFSEINVRLAAIAAKMGPQTKNLIVTKDDITSFWKNSWPYLHRIAHASELTVHELMAEYWSLYELTFENAKLSEKVRQDLAFAKEHLFSSIKDLEAIPPNEKLKPPQWQKVIRVYGAIHSLASIAYFLEETWRDSPTFDPLEVITIAQMKAIFDSLERSNLDHVLKFTRRGSSEEMESTTQNVAPITQEAVTESGVNPQSNDSVLEKSAHTQNNSKPVAVGEQVIETNLAIVLEKRTPIVEGVIYLASTTMGHELEVVLEKPIVKELDGNNSEAVIRLLRSIFHSNGATQGIKMLSDIGSHIVELKARMHGHKRIFGCLKGRKLVLKKFEDIQANRSAYARQIPTNFCH